MSLPKFCMSFKTVSNWQSLKFLKNELWPVKKMKNMSIRQASSTSKIQPYEFLERDVRQMYKLMTKEVHENVLDEKFKKVCTYYFDINDSWITTDSFVIRATLLISGAINNHLGKDEILETQQQIGRLGEMLLVAFAMYDDALENAEFRKGIPSINSVWGARGASMASMMVQNVAYKIASRMENRVCIDAVIAMNSCLVGEFLQYETQLTDDLMATYLDKTYQKSAHFAAMIVRAAAVLGGANDHLAETAFQIGRNLTMVAQILDDLQDYVSTPEMLGKHAGADLRDGIVTAPLIYAYEKYHDEMRPLILRRFQGPNDRELALDLIKKANGIEETRKLVQKFIEDTNCLVKSLKESPYQQSLLTFWDRLFKVEVPINKAMHND